MVEGVAVLTHSPVSNVGVSVAVFPPTFPG